jgi:hypothetical protein
VTGIPAVLWPLYAYQAVEAGLCPLHPFAPLGRVDGKPPGRLCGFCGLCWRWHGGRVDGAGRVYSGSWDTPGVPEWMAWGPYPAPAPPVVR